LSEIKFRQAHNYVLLTVMSWDLLLSK
jgi:hypothetical protein